MTNGCSCLHAENEAAEEVWIAREFLREAVAEAVFLRCLRRRTSLAAYALSPPQSLDTLSHADPRSYSIVSLAGSG